MSSSEPLVQSVLLGDAIEHAPVAVLVADEEMQYVAANATACELLGYERGELLQLKVTDVASYPEAEGEFEAMMTAGQQMGRTTVTTKDGRRLSLRHRSSETDIAGLTYYVAVLWPEP
ncbi:MAG TPA: PAS domain-containing protein [Gaiellaceae bacterium]|jgi:PAS domain S-box-containing protein